VINFGPVQFLFFVSKACTNAKIWYELQTLHIYNYWIIDLIIFIRPNNLLRYVYPNFLSINIVSWLYQHIYQPPAGQFLSYLKINKKISFMTLFISIFNSVFSTIWDMTRLAWDSLHLCYDCRQRNILSKIIIIMFLCTSYNRITCNVLTCLPQYKKSYKIGPSGVHARASRMSYTRFWSAILYSILYWTRICKTIQYSIPILYQVKLTNIKC
jgi:hypothetical protein